VEFDPMIGSAVHEFLQYWKMANEDGKPNLNDSVRKYLMLTPSGRFGLFTPNRFFRHLKEGDPSRYKIAVKKFLQELKGALNVS
jgi:hypothetical protein